MKSLQASMKDGVSEGWEKSLSKGVSESFSKAYQDSETAAQTLKQADSFSQTMGSGFQMDGLKTAKTLAKNSNSMQMMDSQIRNTGLSKAYSANYNQLSELMDTKDTAAVRAAAAYKTLSLSGDRQSQNLAQMAVMGALGGRSSTGYGEESSNAGLVNSAPVFGDASINAKNQAPTRGETMGEVSNVGERVQTALDKGEGTYRRGADRASSHHAGGLSGVRKSDESNNAAVKAVQVNQANEALDKHQAHMNGPGLAALTALDVMGGYNSMKDKIQGFSDLTTGESDATRLQQQFGGLTNMDGNGTSGQDIINMANGQFGGYTPAQRNFAAEQLMDEGQLASYRELSSDTSLAKSTAAVMSFKDSEDARRSDFSRTNPAEFAKREDSPMYGIYSNFRAEHSDLSTNQNDNAFNAALFASLEGDTGGAKVEQLRKLDNGLGLTNDDAYVSSTAGVKNTEGSGY